MSATFGGTIKLEGESEYRKALSTINQQIKTTASELSLLTVQYDKGEESIEKYTSRNKTLEKEISQQEEKIALLKGALEQAADSYGETDTKTQKYQQSLNQAKAELIKMQREVEENNKAIDDFGKETDSATNELKEFSRVTEDAGDNTFKMGDIIKANLASEAIIGGAKALVSVIGEAVKGMAEMVVNSAAYADEILTLSNNTGVAVQTLENYNTVAQLIDVDTEIMTKSMAKNIKSMDSAKDTYDKLGVSIKKADGTMRDSTTVYWEVIDALGKVENETERDAMAMDLFGKSAQDLNSLIKTGSAGFEELSQKAKGLNATLTEDSIVALGAVDDSIQWLTASLDNTGKIAAAAFAPSITSVIDSATQAAGSLNGLLQAIASGGDTEAAGAEFALSLQEMLSSAIVGLIGILDSVIEPATNALFSVLGETGPELADFAVRTVTILAENLIYNLPLLIDAVLQITGNLLTELSAHFPDIAIAVSAVVPEIVTSLVENIPVLIAGAITLFMALVECLPIIVNELTIALPDLVQVVVSTLVSNTPVLLAAGIELFTAIVSAIPEIALTLWENMPLIIDSIVDGLGDGWSKIKETGGDLLEGLWEGIRNKIEWLKQRLREFGATVLENLKEVFGVHSPSTVMRDQVGVYLAEGVGVGFLDGMEKVNAEIKNALPTDYSVGINAAVNGDIQTSYMVTTLEMFKAALSEYSPVVILDEKVVGKFVLTTVSREVFA